MEVTTERDEGVLVARVNGRIDGSTVVRFEEAIRTTIEESDRAVPMVAKTLSARIVRFAHLCSLPEPLRNFFPVSGLDKIVAIHPSKFESLASLHP